MPRSPQWSLSLQFPQQDPIHPPLLTHRCHMPSPSQQKCNYMLKLANNVSPGIKYQARDLSFGLVNMVYVPTAAMCNFTVMSHMMVFLKTFWKQWPLLSTNDLYTNH